MCGRFGVALPEEIAARFGVEGIQLPPEPRYNLAPTQEARVVLEDGGGRRLAELRWGHEPRWLRERGGGRPLINARAETLEAKPTFREALSSRRAIVPSTHFYEWAGSGRGKTPYAFRLKHGGLFGFAGLWFGEGGERRFLIITTEPNAIAKPIHDRMPAILLPEHEDRWLDPDESEPDRLASLLGPYPAREMEAYPVSKAVNRPGVVLADLVLPEVDSA